MTMDDEVHFKNFLNSVFYGWYGWYGAFGRDVENVLDINKSKYTHFKLNRWQSDINEF